MRRLVAWQYMGHLHLALVVTHNGAAMGLDYRRESCSVEASTGHPARELAVPDTIMTYEGIVSKDGDICQVA